MIDEYWTWIFYGYHSDDLTSQSNRPIVAQCDGCCKYRVVKKQNYRDLCTSCSRKGRSHTPESCRKISESKIGKKRPPFTEEHRKHMSEAGKRRLPATEEAHRNMSAAQYKRYEGVELRNNTKRKHIFSSSNEGMHITTTCIYTPSTDHVCIGTYFSKQQGWQGGAASNKTCPIYLGIVVAERVLAEVFNNTKRMPYGNPDYDFICGQGYKIDVKSSCLRNGGKYWAFSISRNTVADYFLCLAFDDRDSLTPMHLWIVPGRDINHLHVASISKRSIDKWKKYELTNKINQVIDCCNNMKK